MVAFAEYTLSDLACTHHQKGFAAGWLRFSLRFFRSDPSALPADASYP